MKLIAGLLDASSHPRAVVLTLVSGLWTAFMSVIVLLLALVVRHRPTVDFVIYYVWAWPLVRIANVRVEVRGLDNVRPDGPGSLILFNHGSLFDILVLYVYYPRTFRFGAKIELFRIPFFGKAMALVGVLPIDRRNRQRVMAIYDAAIARVESGESFALAPEGTRQMEPRLGPFKRGPFEFAINARADVQPVVLTGVFEVMPRNSIWINRGRWRRRVIMDILAPRSTADLAIEDAPVLLEETHARMAPAFARARRDLGYD